MSNAKRLKPMPPLRSDEEAERFVAEADLTEYDLSGFEPMRFELRRKDKTVSLRLPSELLDAAKEAAAREGIPYAELAPQAGPRLPDPDQCRAARLLRGSPAGVRRSHDRPRRNASHRSRHPMGTKYVRSISERVRSGIRTATIASSSSTASASGELCSTSRIH